MHALDIPPTARPRGGWSRSWAAPSPCCSPPRRSAVPKKPTPTTTPASAASPPATPEAGNEEQQVAYAFHCNGPITGYQLQAQIPDDGRRGRAAGEQHPDGKPLTDTFSCSGEVPGYADNCVGATKGWYETIAGQFSIGTKICAEPRVDPLLTVTYAYLEKGVVTQAISGPFDLGRPTGCPPAANSGFNRLNPKPVALAKPGRARRESKAARKTKRRRTAKRRRPAPRRRSKGRS